MMERERTPFEIVYYAVYLVFEGLSFRSCKRAIEPLIKRTPKAIWDWCQDIGSSRGFHRLFQIHGRRRVKIFAIDDTIIRIGKMQAYVFIALDPFEGRILGLHLAWSPTEFEVKRFLKDLMRKYGKKQIWTDAAIWYSYACDSMKLKHHVYARGSWLFEVVERTIQRLKDRTESFDDLFPCRNHGEKCKLGHVRNWMNLFWLHNQEEYKSFIEGIKKDLIKSR